MDRSCSFGEPAGEPQDSTSIRYVMKNGELFDAKTLDRVWPSARKFPKPYWVREREELDSLRRRCRHSEQRTEEPGADARGERPAPATVSR
jgi:hypothetical protein